MGDRKKHTELRPSATTTVSVSNNQSGITAETVGAFVEREVRPASTEAIANGDLPLDADYFRSASVTELTR